MRIAIFTDTYDPEINGVARTLKRFTQYLSKKGIAFQVFAPEASSELQSVQQVTRFASLPFLLYPESRFAFPNPLKLKQAIREFQPSIIHVATPFNIGLAGASYGKKNNIPMVASYHTHFDDYLSYYNLNFMNKWIWSYMAWFHQPFQKVFVPSNDTKEKLLKEHIHQNIEIWSRGVDHNLYSPAKRNRKILQNYGIKAKNVLLYVGRIAPEKDVQIALDSFLALPDKIRQDSHLIIAGDGPLYKTLSAVQHPQITYTGFIEGEQLAELYASADLFLFPSATETFGNVVLEAMSSGIPVIGARAGGVKEIIQEGKTGILCSPKNTSQFTHALSSLLGAPEKLNRMGTTARQYALTQSWDEIFNRLIRQYQLVVHGQQLKSEVKKAISA